MSSTVENRILNFQHFVNQRLHEIDEQLSVVSEA